MFMFEKIRAAAGEQGYELVHGEESYGKSVFGVIVLVKMDRKYDRKLDASTMYKAVEDIKNGLMTVNAQLDPDGPKTKAAYRAEIVEIYRQAGVEAIYLEELPNGCCGQPCCLNRPWFRVTSSIGHVVIGWRKRVMSIEWEDTVVKKTGYEISSDDVTRWETGIHAWGPAKAAEYVRLLHESVR